MVVQTSGEVVIDANDGLYSSKIDKNFYQGGKYHAKAQRKYNAKAQRLKKTHSTDITSVIFYLTLFMVRFKFAFLLIGGTHGF